MCDGKKKDGFIRLLLAGGATLLAAHTPDELLADDNVEEAEVHLICFWFPVSHRPPGCHACVRGRHAHACAARGAAPGCASAGTAALARLHRRLSDEGDRAGRRAVHLRAAHAARHLLGRRRRPTQEVNKKKPCGAVLEGLTHFLPGWPWPPSATSVSAAQR